jgi:ubiquinone/menaquinone biosynthesis C-methylase UbiE
MAEVLVCPNCKNNIYQKDLTFLCDICEQAYQIKDGYIDFIPDVDFYAGEVPQIEMRKLISNIDRIGYDESLVSFFAKFPYLRQYVTDTKRADWVFHCLGRNTNMCLDIGSGLGNNSERMSHLFDKVFSVEAVVERIEFQKRRFKNAKLNNISIIRNNAYKLPFKNNTFDLVICNGVLEWIGMMNTAFTPYEAQLSFLEEMKRVLRSGGYIYIGIENRIGLQFFLGAKDHSGLRFTSLLPRYLANFVVKRLGNSGGIYGDKTLNRREERGYFTYTYSLKGYRSLFQKAGLETKSFWAFPSYNGPYYTGRVDDKLSMKGLISLIKNTHPNFRKMNIKFRVALYLLDKMPKEIVNAFTNSFIPSFLFFCYKDAPEPSIDEYLMKKTSLDNYSTLSEGANLKYIFFNQDGIPQKISHIRRDIRVYPGDIVYHDRALAYNSQSKDKIWIYDWVSGKRTDPYDINEINLALHWLSNFQNSAKNSIFSRELILEEVNGLRTEILKIPDFNLNSYVTLIKKYESYLLDNNIHFTSVHGDFWYGNILIDNNTKHITVIDWEYFRDFSDPFFDFVFFIINIILSQNLSVRTIVNDNLETGQFKVMKSIMEKHFGIQLDFHLLLSYNILKYAVRRLILNGPLDTNYNKLREMLCKLLE